MASSDFVMITDALDAAAVRRGAVQGATTPPSGGGSFVYGFNSVTNAQGTVALYTSLVNFAPTAKGGQVSAALKRGLSGGPTGFATWIFLGLEGTSAADSAYMLGLSDSDPHHIVLRKGALVGSLPDAAPGAQGVLARGSVGYAPDTWVQLRLDMIVNDNGDVVLDCFQNDINAHAVTSPTWVAIPGFPNGSRVIDDALGVVTGSAPLSSGRIGFGFASSDVSRRAFVDALVIKRQV